MGYNFPQLSYPAGATIHADTGCILDTSKIPVRIRVYNFGKIQAQFREEKGLIPLCRRHLIAYGSAAVGGRKFRCLMLVTAAYLGARQLVVQEAEAILDAPRACGQRLDGRRDVVHDGQAGGRGVGVVGLRGSPVLPREPQRQRGLVDFLRRRPPLGPLSFLLPLAPQ